MPDQTPQPTTQTATPSSAPAGTGPGEQATYPKTPAPVVPAATPQQAQDKAVSSVVAESDKNAADQAAALSKPGNAGSRILHALADALGGPKETEKYNAKTGEMETVEHSGAQRFLHGLGVIMTGAGAGAGAHGPGHVGTAMALGAKAERENLDRDNKFQLNQLQMYHNHLTDLHTLSQMSHEDQEWQIKVADHDRPLIEDLRNEGWADTSNGVPMTEADTRTALADLQRQGYKPSQIQWMNADPVPNDRNDPKKGTQQTYFLLVPPGGPSNTAASQQVTIGQGTANNLSQSTGETVSAGQKVPAVTLATASTQNNVQSRVIHSGQQELKLAGIADIPPVDMSTMTPQEKAVGQRAMAQWNKIHMAGGDPVADLKRMEEGDKNIRLAGNPTGAAWIAEHIYGGHEKAVSDEIANTEAAAKAKAEEAARIEAQKEAGVGPGQVKTSFEAQLQVSKNNAIIADPNAAPEAKAKPANENKAYQAVLDAENKKEVDKELRLEERMKRMQDRAADVKEEAANKKRVQVIMKPVYEDQKVVTEAAALIGQAEGSKASTDPNTGAVTFQPTGDKPTSSDIAYADKALAMAALRAEMSVTQHYRVTQAEIEMQYNNGTLAETWKNKFERATKGGFDHQTRMGMLHTIETVAGVSKENAEQTLDTEGLTAEPQSTSTPSKPGAAKAKPGKSKVDALKNKY